MFLIAHTDSFQMEQELMESRAAQEKLQRMAADSEARADAASAQVYIVALPARCLGLLKLEQG